MKPNPQRMALAALIGASALVGIFWWRLHDQRTGIERELAAVVAKNHKRVAVVARRQAEAAVSTVERVTEPAVAAVSWQEQIRALSEALKSERLARPVSRGPRRPEGPGGGLFKELMDDPEYARLAMTIWRTGWRAQWLRPFRWAGIPPDKQERLYSLILDQGHIRDDAGVVGKEFGLGQEAILQLQRQEAARIEAETRALLGDDAYDRLLQARRASGANELISRLESRLSYAATALEPAQGEQLFALLVRAKVGFMVEPGQLNPVLEQARGFLRTDQLAVLEEVADEFNIGKRSEPAP